MASRSDDIRARTEIRARVVNENIERGRDPGDDATTIRFLCECGHSDCTQLIEMTAVEYEAIRGHSIRFAIIDGHELAQLDQIIERHPRYLVVAKRGDAGDLAKARDPR